MCMFLFHSKQIIYPYSDCQERILNYKENQQSMNLINIDKFFGQSKCKLNILKMELRQLYIVDKYQESNKIVKLNINTKILNILDKLIFEFGRKLWKKQSENREWIALWKGERSLARGNYYEFNIKWDYGLNQIKYCQVYQLENKILVNFIQWFDNLWWII